MSTPTLVSRVEHADAMDNEKLICAYKDIGVGPAVVFDGAPFSDAERLQAWIDDLQAACDWLAMETGVERGQPDRDETRHTEES